VTGGFTLIELITAIGITVVLLSLAIAVLQPGEQFRKSRDAKRKADLGQIQRALETYYQDYGRYPMANANEEIVVPTDSTDPTKEWGSPWRPYIDVLPIDSNASKNYAYWVDEAAGGQAYRLYASLDRGDKDEAACAGGAACPNLPQDVTCGGICNYGVSSPNVSP